MFVFFLSSSFVLWGFLVFLLHNFLLFRHVDKERPQTSPPHLCIIIRFIV